MCYFILSSWIFCISKVYKTFLPWKFVGEKNQNLKWNNIYMFYLLGWWLYYKFYIPYPKKNSLEVSIYFCKGYKVPASVLHFFISLCWLSVLINFIYIDCYATTLLSFVNSQLNREVKICLKIVVKHFF